MSRTRHYWSTICSQNLVCQVCQCLEAKSWTLTQSRPTDHWADKYWPKFNHKPFPHTWPPLYYICMHPYIFLAVWKATTSCCIFDIWSLLNTYVHFQTWWPNELNLNLLYFILWPDFIINDITFGVARQASVWPRIWHSGITHSNYEFLTAIFNSTDLHTSSTACCYVATSSLVVWWRMTDIWQWSKPKNLKIQVSVSSNT